MARVTKPPTLPCQIDGIPITKRHPLQDERIHSDDVSNDTDDVRDNEAHSDNINNEGPRMNNTSQDNTGTHHDEQPEHSDEDGLLEEQTDRDLLQVDMQRSPTGITTFGYESVLHNYIKYSRLDDGHSCSPRLFTPIFLHDFLMLPGALAALIGKTSPLQMINRMTPALLPGFQTFINPTTQLPYVVQTTDPNSYVQGVLVFGQNPQTRKLVHDHYGKDSKRIKTNVQADFRVLDPLTNNFRLERKMIRTVVWMQADVDEDAGDSSWAAAPQWTIENYISNSVAGALYMRVSFGGIGEDYEGPSTDSESTQEGSDDPHLEPTPSPTNNAAANIVDQDSDVLW